MQIKNLKITTIFVLLCFALLSSCVSQGIGGKGELTGEATNISGSTAAIGTPQQNPDPNNTFKLELTSRGITYQLVEHWVYSSKNGVVADGKWFDKQALELDQTLKEDLATAKEIPFADDFAFMEVGPGGSTKVDKLTMNIFDEDLNVIQSNVEKPLFPSKPGLYYVAVLMARGDKDNGSGYQYIFKTRRQ